MESTTILDTFPGTIQEVSNASKHLGSTYFPPVHIKQSHVMSELGSGIYINTYVIKKWQVVFQIIDWGEFGGHKTNALLLSLQFLRNLGVFKGRSYSSVDMSTLNRDNEGGLKVRDTFILFAYCFKSFGTADANVHGWCSGIDFTQFAVNIKALVGKFILDNGKRENITEINICAETPIRHIRAADFDWLRVILGGYK